MDELLFILVGLLLAFGLIYLRRRIWAFHGQTPEDYEDAFPVFEFEKHLNGEMICEGVIFGPFGRVSSTFTAEFDINWDGPNGEMNEVFQYNDGSTQKRQWLITLDRDGTFTTSADDVPGGGKGTVNGSAVQMRYRIKVPESAGSHVLDTVDWMYLTPNGTIVNRSQFRKFGFKVAELVATIRPKGTP